MPTLHVYGIALSPLELTRLLSVGDVCEIMEFRTCDRTESYVVSEADKLPLENRFLRYHYRNGQAAAHLFAGEAQISSRLARAAAAARIAGTLGPVLEHLVAVALRCAKRVRQETRLDAGDSGTGHAVLEAIRCLIPPAGRCARPLRVLLLGAGPVAAEVAIHLLDPGQTSREITIAGIWAPAQRAAPRFAAKFGLPCLSARQAAGCLQDVDAVVAAGSGPLALLSEPVLVPILQARPNPLLIVDLGTPANLDSCLAQRDGLNAIFLDQLRPRRKDRNRSRQIDLAQRIVASESLLFENWRIQSPARQTTVASRPRTDFGPGQSINRSNPRECRR